MRLLILSALPLLALAAGCNKSSPDAGATDTASPVMTDTSTPAMGDTATPMGTDTATPMATGTMSSSAAMAAPPTPTYLAKAGASDLFEIQSSKAILAKTKNPNVADFATEMVKDHSESTAMVKQAAMSAGMTPKPPMLDAAQTSMLAAIKSASGADADALYIADQKKAHPMALALQSAYAANGDTPALKTVAGKIVPVVKSHIAMLDKMPG